MHHNHPLKHACFLLILALALSATLAGQRVPQTYADSPYLFRLPLVAKSEPPNALPTPLPGTPPEQLALDRINAYRALAGVPLMALHVALLVAAQHHADYDLLNYSDPAAWNAGPHGEVQGKPKFSGTTPGDRAVAAGYPWAAGWEVIGHFDDPLRTIDGLTATVFHRINILTLSHAYLGYGHGRSAVEAVDVLDFGRGPVTTPNLPDMAVYPAPGQVDVPTGSGRDASPAASGRIVSNRLPDHNHADRRLDTHREHGPAARCQRRAHSGVPESTRLRHELLRADTHRWTQRRNHLHGACRRHARRETIRQNLVIHHHDVQRFAELLEFTREP